MALLNELQYLIALTYVKHIGHVSIRNLISYCGSAEKIFNTSKEKLMKVPGIDSVRADAIKSFSDFQSAIREYEYLQKHNLSIISYYNSLYPIRLKNINESPPILYFKGQPETLQKAKTIALVGTRKATPYGKQMVSKLIEGLAVHKPVIISGLAYGIDTMAHKAAMEHGLDTIAVLAHGLNTIYPSANKPLAEKIIHQGGLCTSYRTDQDTMPEYFAERNRLIAALSDAVIIVESAETGGALITAQHAIEYNKDVFAVPGRAGDIYSEGCNALIKSNMAALIESADDLTKSLRWDAEGQSKSRQRSLFIQLSEQEQVLFDFIKSNPDAHIDTITMNIDLAPSKIANLLLELEINGVVLALPGKRFRVYT